LTTMIKMTRRRLKLSRIHPLNIKKSYQKSSIRPSKNPKRKINQKRTRRILKRRKRWKSEYLICKNILQWTVGQF